MPNIVIDKEFAAMIPALSAEERQQLEANIVEHGGARDPLVVWIANEWRPAGVLLLYDNAEVQEVFVEDEVQHLRTWVDPDTEDEWEDEDWPLVLLDGHNRYEICTRLGLPFEVHAMRFDSREEAEDWIDRNQLGRRNLHPDAFTLLLGRRYNRTKKAAGAQPGNDSASKNKVVNVTTLKSSDRLAAEHGVTEKTVRNAGKFAEAIEKAKAIDPEIEKKAAAGTAPARSAVVKAAAILEKSPERAKEIIAGGKKMSDVIREEKRAAVVAKLESVEAKEAKALAGLYDVIVIDPPWPMEKIERDVRPNQSEFDYPTMKESEMAGMKMPAASDCHMWLWTTHRFMPMAFRLLDAWQFKYVCTFVWHKPGGFQPIGLPQYNCEFAIYARRGTPQFIDTKAFPVCFDAPRGKHSEKPEAFYDVVRRVTAGRRVDIFNRRDIEGFDVWGKEAGE